MRQMLRSQVNPLDVRAVFLTHLHGDHCYGIPGLGMAMLGLKDRESPYLFSPKGLDECFRGPMGLRGFRMRSVIRPASDRNNYHDPTAIYFDHVNKCYNLYEDERFTIKATVIKHSVFCLGYVIEEKPIRGNFNLDKVRAAGLQPGPILGELEEKGKITLPDGREITTESLTDPPRRARKVVILGDTCDPSTITKIAMDADVVVHEATCSDEERTVALSHMHSTAGMAGAFAKRINARNLIITHFSPRNFHGNEYDECVHVRTLVEQARQAFGKPTVYPAHDFWRFPIMVDQWGARSKGTLGEKDDVHSGQQSQIHSKVTRTDGMINVNR